MTDDTQAEQSAKNAHTTQADHIADVHNMVVDNPTDTNQASEDELDNILNWHSHCREEIKTKAPGWADPKYAEMQYQTIVTRHRNEARAAIQSLIRTEKLKLLAEVRERVVGEDEFPVEKEEWYGEEDAKIIGRDELRYDQRTELTKLEAEL